jgi:hypothetical protein
MILLRQKTFKGKRESGSNVGLTEYYGLWQRCVSGDNHTSCTSLTCGMFIYTAAEKRLFSIKNVVINLDSATIKWNGQFTNYHGKIPMKMKLV